MKKTIIAVIAVVAVLACGVTAYAIQGLDETKSTRIPANDGYATITTDTVGGTIETTADVLRSVVNEGKPGIHVTDTYSVFSMDKTFVSSLLDHLSGNSVSFHFGYNSAKTDVTFSIRDGNGNDIFAPKGRCVGEFPYSGSAAETLAVMSPQGKAVPIGAYYPDGSVVRWQLNGCGTYTLKNNDATFNDISKHWGATYITFLASRGVASGMGDGSFSPNQPLTRAQFITFLAYMSMEDVTKYSSDAFSDVTSGKWYYHYVSWAYTNGITKGTSATQFSPEARVTREQMARLTVTFFEYMGIDAKAICSAQSFTDSNTISSWAQDGVAKCQTMGIVSGYEDASFKPQGNATRAEAATICSRIISYALIMPQ